MVLHIHRINIIFVSDSGFNRSISYDSNASGDSSRSRNNSILHDIPITHYENILELAKEKNGCKLLQHKIIEEPLASDYIYDNIKNDVVNIMIDQYGNYLFQKIYENINQTKRYEIMTLIEPEILFLCNNTYGTRGIQKIITVYIIFLDKM